MAKVIIPTPLRKFTDGQRSFESSAGTVSEAIGQLTSAYPGISDHLFDKDKKVRSFIKVFVGEDDIKDLKNGDTEVAEATVISIVPAIAGGKN